MVSATSHIEEQLDTWYACINKFVCMLILTLRRSYDRLPPSLHRSGTEELLRMIQGRIFECKIWLYRPFLYYAIHSPVYSPNWNLALPFVDKALSTCFRAVAEGTSQHRHHGTFFAIRCPVAQSLCLIAASRSEAVRERLQPDWREQIEAFIQRSRYWEAECPGVTESIELLRGQLR